MYNESKLSAYLINTPIGAKRIIFTAIRTAYSPEEPINLWLYQYKEYEDKEAVDGLGGTEVDRLFRSVIGRGHSSVLEHISFTFVISGVSRALLAQLTRHRIGFSPTVQSQRYVGDSSAGKKGGISVIVPGTIAANTDAQVLFESAIVDVQRAYNKLIELNIPKEDARSVLPNAASTNITLSMNLRAFIQFYMLRHEKGGAQAEIKEFSQKLKDILVEENPWIQNIFNIYKE